MDTLVFEGKEYIKGAVLAARFRYTADYLGQLCRGKKVDARLVGRAWYVNLDSLLEHRANRHKGNSSDEILPKRQINNYLSRVDVEPILKNKTVRILKGKNGNFSEVPVKYEADEQALIPRINHRAVFASLPITPAEAEVLHISNDEPKTARFKAEALPEVSLSGKLTVLGIPEEIEAPVVVQNELESPSADLHLALEKPKNIVKTVTVRPLKAKRLGTPVAVKVEEVTLVKRVQAEPALVRPQPLTAPAPVSFKPTSVVKVETTPAASSGSFWLPLVSSMLAVILAVGMFSAGSESTVSRSGYQERIVLTATNLKVTIAQIFSR